MKKIFTLAAASALAAASLGAQAQITLDGKVDPTEIATTPTTGKYQLVSTYSGTHSEAGLGLQTLYVGASATKLYMAVVGAFEQTNGSYPAVLTYLNLPNKKGVAAGTKLAGGNAPDSPLQQKPTMDFEVDYGLRINFAPVGNANTYISYVDYTGGNPTGGAPDTYQGNPNKSGAPATASATTGPFTGWRVAYLTAASVTANAVNAGVEYEFDLASLGLTAGNAINMFVAYTNDKGIFTSDTFPPIAGQMAALAPDQDFTAIPGNQFLTYQLGTGVLATKAAAPVAGLSVYPNPVADASTVTYQVSDRATNVHIVLTDLLGRTVRTVENGLKPVGLQTTRVDASTLAAGTYLLRVQVGDNVSTSKLAVR